MKKFILASIALLFLTATVAEATGNPRLGLTRWQNKAGWGSVDSLTWSNQGGNTRKDSIGTTLRDTTTNEVDISGCNYVAVWLMTSAWQRAGIEPITAVRYNFQVSPDLGTWITLATNYSQTCVATDTEVVILYDKDAAGDTIVGGAGSVTSGKTVTGADMRKVRASKYLRVLVISTGAASDSTLLKGTICVREWPLDIQ